MVVQYNFGGDWLKTNAAQTQKLLAVGGSLGWRFANCARDMGVLGENEFRKLTAISRNIIISLKVV